jgi:hypothetical protein
VIFQAFYIVVPSLAKRGEGRFLDDVLITKIPPNLPFPKGGISDIF